MDTKERSIYLDNNATTPVDRAVLEAMLPYLKEGFGNPSSIHSVGTFAKHAIEESRKKISELLNCYSADQIIFVSSATEANNLAILGTLYANPWIEQLVISSVEHPSVSMLKERVISMGKKVQTISVDRDGNIDIESYERALDRPSIVSVMTVNNETGILFPVRELADIAHKKDCIFHTDAVQAFGKMLIDPNSLNVDLISASAHKFNGPKGAGFLFYNLRVQIDPINYGGGQENGLRSGTENVPAIVGMAKALEISTERLKLKKEDIRLKEMRDRMEERLIEELDDIIIVGKRSRRISNTSCMIVPDIESDALCTLLDEYGIQVSPGAACSSNKDHTRVLAAMGYNEKETNGAIRVSIGHQNTEDELNFFVDILPHLVTELRGIG